MTQEESEMTLEELDPLLALKMEEGAMGQAMWVCGWTLKAGNSLQMTASKKTEISALQLQGTIFYQHPE